MKGKKLAVGAALVAVPSLALAAPAAADRSNSSTARSDVAFTYDGTPVFCTVIGHSDFLWDEETNRTTVSGYTQFRGEAGSSAENETRCRNIVILSSKVTVHWLDGDNRIHGTEGFASVGSFVQTTGFAPGNVNEVNGNHVVEYYCDSGNVLTVCSHSVTTSPSTK
jgi:hypothetical protein